jgi:GDPmannose 4,6-dehydratase
LNLKNINIEWKGEGLHEIGYCKDTKREYIFISSKYFRNSEVDELLGNSQKAFEKLGWKPEITFDELVKEMVDYDCK